MHTIVLRPGALGDVLATRSLLRFCKLAAPDADVGLIAPGERGRFLCRPGFADRAFDWERRDLGWLFDAETTADPPAALTEFFRDARLVLAFLGGKDTHSDAALAERLALLAPGADIVVRSPAPPAGAETPIGRWLLDAAVPVAETRLPRAETARLAEAALTAKISVPPLAGFAVTRPYFVLHPGSGSGTKNWPLANFATVGKALSAWKNPAGRPYFHGAVVTAGEADGDLGARLAGSLPEGTLVATPDLESLAAVLAGADLYMGNDSGASHLADSVKAADGNGPMAAVIFGPSDSRVWAPPGALVFQAGRTMAELDPAVVVNLVREYMQKDGRIGFSC